MSELKTVKKVQVIILAEGEILLLKLSEARGGFWQNVTGHVDPGEDFLTAAIREVKEETNIEGLFSEIPLQYEFVNRFNNFAIEKVFLCKLKNKIDPKLSDEHQTFLWKKLQLINVNDYKYPSNYGPIEWLKNQ